MYFIGQTQKLIKNRKTQQEIKNSQINHFSSEFEFINLASLKFKNGCKFKNLGIYYYRPSLASNIEKKILQNHLTF